jgi:hypothetical protein
MPTDAPSTAKHRTSDPDFDGNSTRTEPCGTQLCLAMTHHKRGDAAKAKDWLQQADDQIKKRQEDKDVFPNWQERLRDQKLRQEAADLVNSPPGFERFRNSPQNSHCCPERVRGGRKRVQS